MAKIKAESKVFLGGDVYSSLEEYTQRMQDILPQDISIINLERAGLLQIDQELLENGTVIRQTRIFANQEVFDVWKENLEKRRTHFIKATGFEVIEGPVFTELPD